MLFAFFGVFACLVLSSEVCSVLCLVCCSLLVVYCSLCVVCCLLVCGPLSVARWSGVCCSLFVVC